MWKILINLFILAGITKTSKPISCSVLLTSSSQPRQLEIPKENDKKD
jgi:hypothetical protein